MTGSRTGALGATRPDPPPHPHIPPPGSIRAVAPSVATALSPLQHHLTCPHRLRPSSQAGDRPELEQVLRTLQHPPSIHSLPNSTCGSFYLSPFRLVFVLEKTRAALRDPGVVIPVWVRISGFAFVLRRKGFLEWGARRPLSGPPPDGVVTGRPHLAGETPALPGPAPDRSGGGRAMPIRTPSVRARAAWTWSAPATPVRDVRVRNVHPCPPVL